MTEPPDSHTTGTPGGGHPSDEQLFDLVEGTLTSAHRESVERHVAACAVCTAQLTAARAGRDLARVKIEPMPAVASQRLTAALAREWPQAERRFSQARTHPTRGWWRRWNVGVAAGLGVAMVAGVVAFGQLGAEDTATRAPQESAVTTTNEEEPRDSADERNLSHKSAGDACANCSVSETSVGTAAGAAAPVDADATAAPSAATATAPPVGGDDGMQPPPAATGRNAAGAAAGNTGGTNIPGALVLTPPGARAKVCVVEIVTGHTFPAASLPDGYVRTSSVSLTPTGGFAYSCYERAPAQPPAPTPPAAGADAVNVETGLPPVVRDPFSPR